MSGKKKVELINKVMVCKVVIRDIVFFQLGGYVEKILIFL